MHSVTLQDTAVLARRDDNIHVLSLGSFTAKSHFAALEAWQNVIVRSQILSWLNPESLVCLKTMPHVVRAVTPCQQSRHWRRQQFWGSRSREQSLQSPGGRDYVTWAHQSLVLMIVKGRLQSFPSHSSWDFVMFCFGSSPALLGQ